MNWNWTSSIFFWDCSVWGCVVGILIDYVTASFLAETSSVVEISEQVTFALEIF